MKSATKPLVSISLLAATTALVTGSLVLNPGTAAAQSLTVVPASAFTGPVQQKPGFSSPMGDYRSFDTSTDLSFVGNGFAQAAVAKDVIGGFSGVHQAAYANDGYYGNGASWVGASASSWLKIDLGRVVSIGDITFGRDRLGSYDDRDPGQFFIEVAVSDAVYANGDDSADAQEYIRVFDSAALGYDGVVNGSQTLQATLASATQARFVKVTFANSGTAVDELQVHAVQTAAAAPEPGTIALLLTAGIPVIGIARRRVKKS